MAKLAGCLTMEEKDGMICASFKVIGENPSPDIVIGAILAPLIMEDLELRQKFQDLMTAAVSSLMTGVCGMKVVEVQVIQARESRH